MGRGLWLPLTWYSTAAWCSSFGESGRIGHDRLGSHHPLHPWHNSCSLYVPGDGDVNCTPVTKQLSWSPLPGLLSILGLLKVLEVLGLHLKMQPSRLPCLAPWPSPASMGAQPTQIPAACGSRCQQGPAHSRPTPLPSRPRHLHHWQ